MKIKTKVKSKTYPYLAIMSFGEIIEDSHSVISKDIMLVSKIIDLDNEGKEAVYVQYIDGHSPGWITEDEKDYEALPAGYEVTYVQ